MRAIGRFLLGLILLILLIVGGSWAVWRVLTLSSEIGAALLLGSAAVIAPALSYFFTRRADRNRLIEEEHRKQKIPIYEDFMEFAFTKLFSKRTRDASLPEQELAEYFASFTRQMIVWGSDGVIRSFSAFRRDSQVLVSSPDPRDQIDVMLTFEELLFSFRQDIGHGNKGMNQGDLLRLFINDFDSFVDQHGVQLGKRRSPK